MIAIDTNLLVYAHRREAPGHDRAAQLLSQLARGPERWGIPWPCVAEFFSVVTNPKIWKGRESTPTQALAQVGGWSASPSVVLLAEVESTLEVLSGIVRRAGVRGAAIHDARIAAICLSHGVTELLTADRDFSRFHELVVRNPLGP